MASTSTCTSLSTSSNQIPLSIEESSCHNQDNHIHNHRSTTINRIRSRSTSKQIPSIITTSPSATSSIHPDTSTSTSTTLEHPSSIDRSTISTPDFTLNSSSSTSTSTSPRRIALIRAHTSTVQSTSVNNPTSDPSGKQKSKFNLHRSNSDRNLHSLNNTRDASESSSTSSDLPLQRPALPSRMTSFISSFITRVSTTNNSDEDSSKTTTISDTSRSNSLDEKSGSNNSYYNNLIMPFARTAGPDAPFPYGFSRGLNNDSPPLTPTSENDGRISNEDFPPSHHHEHHHQQNQRLPYHTAKHQWSTAQANADASSPTMINGSSGGGLGSQDYPSLMGGGEISPISRSWAFSPPLTISTSSSRSSPVQSLRAFSPPVRPGSNSSVRIISTPTPLGLLPSHSEDSTMMTGYPLEYDYHPGKSPPPIDHTFSSSENQHDSTSTSTNLNLTSTRLRLSLQSLIPRSLSRNQNRSTSSTSRGGGERFSWKLPPLRPHLPTIMSILIFLVFSTISLTMALSTLPLHLPRSFSSLTLNEIRELCSSLKIYSESSNQAYLHTLTVMSSAFVFLHTFNVPGSLLLNVLFGATFGTTRGTIWTSLLTAVGGTGCYLICSKLAPIIKAFPGLEKPLNAMRKALTPKQDNVGMVGGLNRRGSRLSSRRNSRIQTSSSSPNQEKFPTSPSSNRNHSPNTSGRNSPIVTSPSPSFQNFMSSQASNDNGSTSTETKISSGSSLWSYLLLLRVLPIVPYGVMNVACGVLGVPILPFFGTLGIGSIPWNAVTAQSGELLLDLAQAVSEGFEDLKVSDIPNQISEKLTEFDLLNLSIDNEDLKLNSKVMIKETKEVAKSGLKIILKRIWKKEMLIRLGLLTMIVLLPILIATLLKKRKERKDKELLENMRLLREEEEEVLDEEEGRIGEQDFEDDEDEKLDYQDEEEENEMRNHHDDDGLPVSNSTSSNWSGYSWNSGFSNSEISGNSSRLGHKRMATDG